MTNRSHDELHAANGSGGHAPHARPNGHRHSAQAAHPPPTPASRPSRPVRPRAAATRTVRAGEPLERPIWPMAEAIQPAAVYGFADPASLDDRRLADPPLGNYSRDGMANAASLERAVADLEGAEGAHATSSGMAALALVFLSFLRAGDDVVIAPDAYCDTETLLVDELGRYGVRTVFADTGDAEAVARALTPQTRLIHAESIVNPSLTLSDLPGLGALARRHGCLLSVDNTLATPLLCRPLEHGADLVVHSVTKFLGGHHDLTAGIVCGRQELLTRLRYTGYLYGPTLNPFGAWLAVRGIKTLAPRMDWISRSAARIAAFLEGHPAVGVVRYPGLPGYGQADLARRMLPDGAGGVMLAALTGGPSAAYDLLMNLDLIAYAPSLGGTSTTASYPPITLDRQGPVERVETRTRSATIRFSIGLEDADDLIADLEQALDRLPVMAAPGRRAVAAAS